MKESTYELSKSFYGCCIKVKEANGLIGWYDHQIEEATIALAKAHKEKDINEKEIQAIMTELQNISKDEA